MYPIPANATRIRYLESTGTQYIDTGINPDNETDVAGRFELLSANQSFCFGAYTVWNSDTVGLYVGSTSDVYFRVGGTQKSFGRGFQGEIIDFSLVGTELVVNGTTTTMPLRVSCAKTISVFAFSGETSGACRCLEFSVFKSGVLVRSYVPMRIGQAGYLFDRVSGQLFGNAADNNAGFPAECLGPDTFASGVVPTRMMPMGVRRKEVWPTPLYTGVSLVGSSVQNNAGILSGFTNSSYAKMPFYWTAGASQIEAVIKIHFAQSGSAQGIWGCVGSTNAFTPFYYQGNNGPLGSYISISGVGGWNATPDGASGSKKVYWQNTKPASAGDYILRETFSSGAVATSHWSGSWLQDSFNALAAVHGDANLVPQLGTNRGSNNPFLGTIDLNYTYLMRDGELWWEGAPGAYKNVKTTYPD